jgi:hypothetical protein
MHRRLIVLEGQNLRAKLQLMRLEPQLSLLYTSPHPQPSPCSALDSLAWDGQGARKRK